jgi:hypothetical protein
MSRSASLVATVAVAMSLGLGAQVASAATDTFTINIGDTIAPDSPAGAGHIESAGDIDVYAFNATAGQQAFLTFSAVTPDQTGRDCNSFVLTLADPSGAPVASVSLCSPVGPLALASAGQYTLTVRAVTDTTGTYGFTLSESTSDTFAINIGDTIAPDSPAGAGHIEDPGNTDVYTFNAAAGQRVFFNPGAVLADQVGQNCSYFPWTLTDPDGNVVFGAGLSATLCTDIGPLTLPSGGQYTLTVMGYPGYATTGTYGFTVSPAATDTFTINLGDTIAPDSPAGAGHIESAGNQDVYNFNAAAGTQIGIDVQEVDGSQCNPASRLLMRLDGPGGIVAGPFGIANCPKVPVTLE